MGTPTEGLMQSALLLEIPSSASLPQIFIKGFIESRTLPIPGARQWGNKKQPVGTHSLLLTQVSKPHRALLAHPEEGLQIPYMGSVVSQALLQSNTFVSFCIYLK